jgi:hypothetical protein
LILVHLLLVVEQSSTNDDYYATPSNATSSVNFNENDDHAYMNSRKKNQIQDDGYRSAPSSNADDSYLAAPSNTTNE